MSELSSQEIQLFLRNYLVTDYEVNEDTAREAITSLITQYAYPQVSQRSIADALLLPDTISNLSDWIHNKNNRIASSIRIVASLKELVEKGQLIRSFCQIPTDIPQSILYRFIESVMVGRESGVTNHASREIYSLFENHIKITTAFPIKGETSFYIVNGLALDAQLTTSYNKSLFCERINPLCSSENYDKDIELYVGNVTGMVYIWDNDEVLEPICQLHELLSR